MNSLGRSWFVLLALVGACGGRVSVDSEGAGGDGGDGGAGGNGGGGGAGGTALAECNAWCEAYTAHCPSPSCLDDCLEAASYLGPCAPEYEALHQCILADLPLDPEDCNDGVDACGAQRDALLGCVYPAAPCEIGGCKAGSGAGNPSMTCTTVCGDVVYTSLCGKVGDPGFPKECTCQIDGEVVGTCQSVTSLGVGTLGCCSTYFAESE